MFKNKKILSRLMDKFHWTVLLVLVICVIGIIGLGIVSMVYEKEIPQVVITALSSVIFATIGYGVAKEEKKNGEKVE